MLLGLILAYVFLVTVLGFYATTLILIPFYMWILGIRAPKLLVIVTVVVLVLIYIVFTMGLKVPLPKGVLF